MDIPTTLSCGAWGDVIASYGNIRRYLRENNLTECDVVYFGLDENLVAFLKAQDKIRKVSYLKISDPSEAYLYQHMASHKFPEWMEATGMNKAVPDLVSTHVNKYHLREHPEDCNRDFDCQLPVCGANWSEFLEPTKPYLLVQPYSIQSCTFSHHWPHWMKALEWMAETSGMNIVLVGQITSSGDPDYVFPWIEHPRIINLVGQTQNMSDVLHIANEAAGIVTTANSLSMWSIIKKKPALVVCHLLIKLLAIYYYNWINYGTNTVLDHETSLEQFKESFGVWINTVLPSHSIVS